MNTARLVGRVGFALSLLSFAVVVLAWSISVRGDDNRLPTATELIQQTLAIYEGEDKPDSWVLTTLAAAHGYLGEFETARSILNSAAPDFLVNSGYSTIAEIEVSRTGTHSPLPEILDRELPDTREFELARIYAKHGDAKRSLQHLRSIRIGPSSLLRDLVLQILNPLRDGGHHETIREVLVLWSGCYVGAENTFDYMPFDSIDQLVGELHDVGEKAKSRAFCERWNEVMSTDTDLDEHGAYISIGWANLEMAWFRLGEKDRAKEAIDQALAWLERACTTKKEPNQPHELVLLAKRYANLASKIETSLGSDAANETYEKAYQAASMAIPSKYEYFGYQEIVEVLLKNQNFEAAVRTTKGVHNARFQANCWRLICDYALKEGNENLAKSSAQTAVQWLLVNDFKPSIAHDMARVAQSVARAGEIQLAKQLFERAITFSNANDDPKFDHHWIARMQVSAGFLNDAYQTIMAIEDRESRALPLAELARAAAKQAKQPLIRPDKK